MILKPWGWSEAPTPAEQPAPTQVVAMADVPPAPGDDAASEPSAALDNPLRMADLAFQAGMLVEPEEYSAWTLYRGVVKAEPGNTAAVQGLDKDSKQASVRRGETALEQGRFDDARAVVERIRAALPAHAGAKSYIAEKIWPAGSGRAAVAESSFKPELPVQAPPKVAPVQIQEAPAKPVVDPVVDLKSKVRRTR